ncbi:hypothetical protein [Microbacterium sp. 77mftsu3.1]|uniref:hypothetical protein n=1 Tax=Microbacterium sp. 77mftsu3.1 TaxID=1761802 RepID=UPI0008862536|nr:hypothetical protein [Microbacterium sp. 77mftsu3.1]SDH31552.1 hypothetical protein SAMN04488590_3005 [Microbacterium sp. 77mftsu3.1]
MAHAVKEPERGRRRGAPADVSARRHKVADEVADRLREILLGYPGLEDSNADDITRVLTSRLPERNPWPDVIGPCYTSGSLQRELGISRQALWKAVAAHRVLRLTTADNLSVYPAFQVQNGHLVPGLDRVLAELAKGPDAPLMWAQWLNKPRKRPDGEIRRRIDELADTRALSVTDERPSGRIEDLVLEARNTAAAWAA